MKIIIKYLLGYIYIVILLFGNNACNVGKSTTTRKHPSEMHMIEYFTVDSLNDLSKDCYNGKKQKYGNINLIINNNGLVGGNIYSHNVMTDQTCSYNPFIWHDKTLHLLTLDNVSFCQYSVECHVLVDSLSDNNKIVGIISKPDPREDFGFDNRLYYYDSEFRIITNYKNPLYIYQDMISSANGQYITPRYMNGYNKYMYDIIQEKIYPFNRYPDVQFVFGISNDGVFIGDTAVHSSVIAPAPIICDLTKCNIVEEFNYSDTNMGALFTISSNGKFIYGVRALISGINIKYNIFKVDYNSPDDFKIVDLSVFDSSTILNKYPWLSSGTDDGAVVLSNSHTSGYIYSAKNNKLYAMADLLRKVGLEQYISDNAIVSLSSNGKYLLLDLSKDIVHSNKIIAIKINFVEGIDKFCEQLD